VFIGPRLGRVGRPGLIGTAARTVVVAGTATAVSGGIIRHRRQRDVGQAQAAAWQHEQRCAPVRQPEQVPPPAPAPVPTPDDHLAQLERLAVLLQQGVLTADEVAAEKARILAS